MADKTSDIILRNYEEEITQKLVQMAAEANPGSLPIVLMRAQLARLMLKYIAKLTGELESTFAQMERNIGRRIGD
jgi:hypothetical protein